MRITTLQTFTLAVTLGVAGCGSENSSLSGLGGQPTGPTAGRGTGELNDSTVGPAAGKAGASSSQKAGSGGNSATTKPGSGGSGSDDTTPISEGGSSGDDQPKTGGTSSKATGGSTETGNSGSKETGGKSTKGSSSNATGGSSAKGSGGAGASDGGRSSRDTGAGGATVSTNGGSSSRSTGVGGSSSRTSSNGGSVSAGGTSSTKAAGGESSGGSVTGGSTATVKKYVGNITTGDQVDAAGKKFATYWDQITPENAGKWGSVQSSPGGSFNWNTLDTIYKYTQSNSIIFKQHTFIWGAQQPNGVSSKDQVQKWMTEFCSRYPETKLIDVVNEPPPHTTPGYVSALGGSGSSGWDWIANAFKMAREACPNAILLLNDYNNIEWDNAENQQNFIKIVKAIKAAGAPIDAIGCQAHDVDTKGAAAVKPLMEKLHTETGLDLYITEYDADSSNDSTQLDMYKTQFQLFWDTEYVKGITVWGWIVGRTWSQAPNSGLVSSSGQFRPAMTWVMELLGRPTS